MPHPFRQVDVFTDVAFLGNPVAVVLDAGDLDEATMRRVARCGVVVSDLRRTAAGRWLLRLFFPFLGVGYVAKHDGLVSLARAWSLDEVREWLGKTSRYELRRRFPVRFTLVLED